MRTRVSKRTPVSTNSTVPRIEREPESSPLPGYLTTAEISARTGVQQEHIALMIRRGRVKATKFAGSWIIKEEDWEEYERNKKPGGAPRGPRKKRRKRAPRGNN